MIEPVMDALTTLVRPFDKAMPAMINSAALPKVALSNPPYPCRRARPALPWRDRSNPPPE